MNTEKVINGVNVTNLFATLDVVKAQPAAAQFQFRATNEWLAGTHSRSTMGGFFGAGQEHEHKATYAYEADHPTVLVGADNAPTPAEFLLHAIATCLTAGIGNIASARGVKLTRVASTVEGDINLLGLLGLDDSVRNGYQGIRVNFEIEGDAPAEKLRDIVQRSIARSAVYDVFTNGVPVTVSVVA
ncbi:MAG: OsmC family protein [Anaerolineae bacterium]|nr:OsmC family protein [Anaerolineae bacterium]